MRHENFLLRISGKKKSTRGLVKVVLGTDKNGLTCLDETGWINLIG